MSIEKVATIAVRAGIEADRHHGAVVPPIHLSTNYTFAGFNQKRDYDYSRSGNPTRDILAKALADLEGGATGIVTCTGMAAINLVLQLLKPDDLIVVPHDCYGGSYRAFVHLAERGAFKLEVVDQNDQQAVDTALAKKPRILWLETPSNPLLRIVDVQALCRQAKAVGALTVVDNTFLSPVLQQPLALGADIVVHSTTKYINGHSDVVGGAVIAKTAELGEQLAWWANTIGITASAFDCYLTLRGIRTLVPRIKQHQHNANEIVKLLSAHPAVAKVYHPSLTSHPGHETAKRQQSDFGAMISFELAGGEQAITTLLDNLNIFSLAESLGGVESLICHPSTMTHAAMDLEAQAVAGISQQLLRLSVGIESAEDLLNDLGQALDKIDIRDAGKTASITQLDSVRQSDDSELATCRLSPALAALW